MKSELDRFLVGANPVSGVDHFLPERARERIILLDAERAAKIIGEALNAGADGFNFGTSPFILEVLRYLRLENISKNYGLYPIIPDIQKYVSLQLKKGTSGLITETMSTLGWQQKLSTLFRGGVAVITFDPLKALSLLTDIEVSKVNVNKPDNSRIKALFLHEAVSDLIVALRAEKVLIAYVKHVRNNYDFQPGFVTRNLPAFVEFCKSIQLDMRDIVIMTPFNAIGFQMAPSKEDCEVVLSRIERQNVIAMSVFAGGRLDVDTALNYLKNQRIWRICVGVSRETHARETFSLLRRLL